MSPFTIDRARSDFYKYVHIFSKGADAFNHRPSRRKQQVRALFWLYFEVRRVESHIYARDKQALHMLAFTTVKEAHQAFNTLTTRNALEAALIKAMLKLESVDDINDIAHSLEIIEGYRQDAEREGVRTRNRLIGKKGGRPQSPLSKIIEQLVERDPSINLEELWERLAAKADGGVVKSVTDDDVEVYTRDCNTEILSRSAVAKRLSNAKKAFTKAEKQHNV